MEWKIERDPYYKDLYEQYGMDFIVNAGWFPDNATTDFDIKSSLDIMCTPINFVKDNLKNAKRPCILLTTGSFSPVHSGHIEAMVKTKEKMETFGWDVVGGYFVPDHDEYISMKLKHEAIPFHYRMKMILDAVRDIEWLTVDPWAGVFQNVAVNFTDIIYRLDLYVQKHLGVKIPIVYVCGNDNARFANTFINQGYCAIAERPGYENKFEYLPQTEGRIFQVSKPDANSSTSVRKTTKWKEERKNVIVRMDDSMTGIEAPLLAAIGERFNSIKVLWIKDQNKAMKAVDDYMITLDPFTTWGIPFEVSREYDYFGIKRLGFTNRPGSPSIEAQAIRIRDEYNRVNGFHLHDDDICSGDTMKFAKQALNAAGIDIITQMSYTHTSPDTEIIDLRDLMYGENEGGLIIRQIDGSVVRVPYIYPYVCPFIRSSINDPLEFSIKVWEINMKRFADKASIEYEACKTNYELLLNVAK